MRLIFKVLAWLYAAYLAIVFLVLTPALNALPSWYMTKTYDRELHTEIILFNPFTLALQVRKAALPEHDGEPFVALDQATVNLSLESLWQQGWVLDEVSTDSLYVHARQLSEDSFNFSDLIPEEEETAPEPESEQTGIPGFTIHNFDFHAQRLAFTNETREEPYQANFDGLRLTVDDLSTILEEGRPYQLDARGQMGGTIHWEGEVSIPRSYSKGTLALDNLSLVVVWRLLEPLLNFEIRDGRLGFGADYTINWGEAIDYQLSDGELHLSGLDLQPLDPQALPDTAVGLDAFSISGITVDGPAQRAQIEEIVVDGLAVDGWMDEQQISLADLFTVNLPEEEEEEQDGAQAGEDQGSGEDAQWTAAVGSIRLENSRAGWRSQYTDPPQLEVSPLAASVENITWPLGGDSPLTLGLAVNGAAQLAIEGLLDLGSGDGSIDYQLQGLPLPWANPNLPSTLRLSLTSGEVAVEGQVALAGFAPTTVQSEGSLSNFSSKLEGEDKPLTSFETIRWQQLAVDLNERSVSLQKLSIDNYAGRIHIHEDGSVNTQNIWKEEVGERAGEIAEDLSLNKPWTVDIPSIVVTDSEVDFMDESLPINFRTIIGELNGEVLGISSDPDSEARVDFRGSVDGYAPVLLAGTASPLRNPPALDLELTFDGVDLALLTPYSSTYAGYPIDRGLLNLDLQYKLKDQKLEGNNSVMVDKLKLGEKSDSDKAVDIPLKLGLALLTDANGVISLEVPVSGDVDDPGFAIGSVVSKAFINLIVKAATAPFNLLASLVGSEEDLQRVNFGTGAAELDENGKSSLTLLNSALTQRPSVKLIILGRLNPEADHQRLQQMALRQQLMADGLSPQEWETKGPAWEKAVQKRYKALGRAGDEQPPLSLRQRNDLVAASIPIGDAELKQLMEDRAVAVKSYLVNELNLPADRAAIEQTSVDDEANLFSGVELDIDN